MKRIHYRNGIGKIFFDISQIRIIHVGNQVPDCVPFFRRDRSKVGFCDF
jgi:hypothetical protein